MLPFLSRLASVRGSYVLHRLQCLPRLATRQCSTAGSGVPYKQQKVETLHISEVPSSADVVVVGGGVAGCSALYHLACLGVHNAVLLEQSSLTAGTTWHSAGLVWRLRPSDVQVHLLAHTRQLAREVLAEESGGVDCGWIENGGLFVANTKQRLNEYKRLMTVSSSPTFVFFHIKSFVSEYTCQESKPRSEICTFYCLS